MLIDLPYDGDVLLSVGNEVKRNLLAGNEVDVFF